MFLQVKVAGQADGQHFMQFLVWSRHLIKAKRGVSRNVVVQSLSALKLVFSNYCTNRKMKKKNTPMFGGNSDKESLYSGL